MPMLNPCYVDPSSLTVTGVSVRSDLSRAVVLHISREPTQDEWEGIYLAMKDRDFCVQQKSGDG